MLKIDPSRPGYDVMDGNKEGTSSGGPGVLPGAGPQGRQEGREKSMGGADGCAEDCKSKEGGSGARSEEKEEESNKWLMRLKGRYKSMLSRCTNPNNKSYQRYGARGITVCERWRGTGGFKRFVDDMGNPPGDGYSIERMDNNRGYDPDNCCWATPTEQARNRRSTMFIDTSAGMVTSGSLSDSCGYSTSTIWARKKQGCSPAEIASKRPLNCVFETINGRTMNLVSWAREAKLRPKLLYKRYKLGWRGEKLLIPTLPKGQRSV